jgi:Protein of unknown function DUF58
MTVRGRRVLWLALGLYIAAWGFGTSAMFPVAVGLGLAPAAAWAWVRLLDRPMRLRRRSGHLELVEGQSFAVGLEVSADGGPLPARAMVVDRVGERPVAAGVVRTGRVLRGRYEVASALRGRYRLGGAELVIGDGFGLAEARIALDRSDEVIVYPRVYPLEGLFTDAGGTSGEQGRALLHRTAGYDLHSIRDHQRGESLRRVHWRSTAKRRKLMVKELQDTPRDEASSSSTATPSPWPARRPSRRSTTRCAPPRPCSTAWSNPASAARSSSTAPRTPASASGMPEATGRPRSARWPPPRPTPRARSPRPWARALMPLPASTRPVSSS